MSPEVAQLRGIKYLLFTIGGIATCSLPMAILFLLDRKTVAQIGISPFLKPSAIAFTGVPAVTGILLWGVFNWWRDHRDRLYLDKINRHFS
jgi:hypothetical protein